LVEVLGDSFYGFVVACGGFTAHLIQLILFFHIFSNKKDNEIYDSQRPHLKKWHIWKKDK
jgi:hypothetical protein